VWSNLDPSLKEGVRGKRTFTWVKKIDLISLIFYDICNWIGIEILARKQKFDFG